MYYPLELEGLSLITINDDYTHRLTSKGFSFFALAQGSENGIKA